MSDQSPFELYREIEARLSPLLVACLEKHLPTVGDDWWDSCVVKAFLKNPVVNEFLHTKKSFSDFDFPALVNICYYNKKVIRVALGVGDEFTNYLFILKTFRNDVVHNPSMELDKTRHRLIVDSSNLLETLLKGSSNTKFKQKSKSFFNSFSKLQLRLFCAILGIGVVTGGYFLYDHLMTRFWTNEGFVVGLNKEAGRAHFPWENLSDTYNVVSMTAEKKFFGLMHPEVVVTLSLKRNEVMTEDLMDEIVKSQTEFACSAWKEQIEKGIKINYVVIYDDLYIYKKAKIKPWKFSLSTDSCK